jgi:peptide chain release factor 1
MMDRNEIEIQWYSGTGKGGQHRNKHQNCCRLTHILTGLRAVGTGSRERSANLREAMTRLNAKVDAFNHQPKERRFQNEVVRTYHLERGEVVDHATGLRAQPGAVLEGMLDEFLTHPGRDGERPSTGRA